MLNNVYGCCVGALRREFAFRVRVHFLFVLLVMNLLPRAGALTYDGGMDWWLRAPTVIDCYADKADGQKGKCSVVSVGADGTSLTRGSSVTVNEGATNWIFTTPLSSTTAVTCYRDEGYGNRATCNHLTLASGGTTITTGAPLIVRDQASWWMNVVGMTAETAIVCHRYDTGTTSNRDGDCNVLTVGSGGSLTAGSGLEFSGQYTEQIFLTRMSETMAIVCWRNYVSSDSNSDGLCCTLTMSGQTLTKGTDLVLQSGDTTWMSPTALSSTRALVCWRHDVSPWKGYCAVLTVGGTALAKSTSVVINGGFDTNDPSTASLSDSSAVLCYQDRGNSYKLACVHVGIGADGTLSLGAELVVHDYKIAYTGTSVLSSSSVLVCSRDSRNTANYDRVCTVVTVSGTTLTKGTTLVLTKGGEKPYFRSAALFVDVPTSMPTSMPTMPTSMPTSIPTMRVACPAGRYFMGISRGEHFAGMPQEAQAECALCGGGSYQPDEGSTLAACLSPPAGTYVPSYVRGATTPMPCPAGTYSAQGGTACSECPAGSYSLGSAADECVLCAAGTYQPRTGASSCEACRGGSYANTTGSVICTACSAGQVSLPGATQCTDCPAGSFSPGGGTGASSCELCRGGSYASTTGSVICTACPAGQVSLPGATQCTDCPAGSFSPGGGTGASSCELCRGGSYANTTGSVICTACSAGRVSFPGSTQCTDCPAGSFSPGGWETCLPCSPGSYASSTGSAVCTACDTGTEAPSAGATSCDTCSA